MFWFWFDAGVESVFWFDTCVWFWVLFLGLMLAFGLVWRLLLALIWWVRLVFG